MWCSPKRWRTTNTSSTRSSSGRPSLRRSRSTSELPTSSPMSPPSSPTSAPASSRAARQRTAARPTTTQFGALTRCSATSAPPLARGRRQSGFGSFPTRASLMSRRRRPRSSLHRTSGSSCATAPAYRGGRTVSRCSRMSAQPTVTTRGSMGSPSSAASTWTRLTRRAGRRPVRLPGPNESASSSFVAVSPFRLLLFETCRSPRLLESVSAVHPGHTTVASVRFWQIAALISARRVYHLAEVCAPGLGKFAVAFPPKGFKSLIWVRCPSRAV
mmetsp:Transcript_24164/g.56128  ORF Transcript_24164/g.56128 Transcript_24164/m.56128 type:complete len:272 (-) Transcript_24164:372-1187(-)